MPRTAVLLLTVTALGCGRGSLPGGFASDAPNGPRQDTISIQVTEGTTLALDLSRDGRTMVHDLLGQLWLLPADGGESRPITDAVRDTAEDLDPSLSPDGSRVLFRGERAGHRGMFLLEVDEPTKPAQLTELPNVFAFQGQGAWSPDGRTVAFAQAAARIVEKRMMLRNEIVLLDLASKATRHLSIPDSQPARDPAWFPSGERIVFVAQDPTAEEGGRIWSVPQEGGAPSALSAASVQALAPVVSPDGRRLAFLAEDSAGKTQVWVQALPSPGQEPEAPTRLTHHEDVASTRVRWTPDGAALIYSADGALWRLRTDGGEPERIPFEARLRIVRSIPRVQPVHFPDPGVSREARGHLAVGLSPDAATIALIALGKLWAIPVGGEPRALADVPISVGGLTWSPNGDQIVWSAGQAGIEDLYGIEVATGKTRQITELPGRETNPLWSPDGKWIAFVHETDAGSWLRVVRAQGVPVRAEREARTVAKTSATAIAWAPDSQSLLLDLGWSPLRGASAEFVTLEGQHRPVERYLDAPLWFNWLSPQSVLYVRHDRMWTAGFEAQHGFSAEPNPLSGAPAMYASAARDGSILYFSADGWRLRSPSGTERTLGYLLRYTPPVAPPLLIQNVRIIDGTGAPPSEPSDILMRDGRISRIGGTGTLNADANVQRLDGGGRYVIPGLMDLHAHIYPPGTFPGLLYFGVTTIRDQGSAMHVLVASAEAAAAGVLPGPRVGYGGFQFYSDWPFDYDQGRGIEPEADSGHIGRAIALAAAFGAQHVKTRTFRRWDINARIAEAAHRRGMRVTGHCAHPLPLVAAGIDAKEHIGTCTARGETYMYDDIIQLFKAANISVVPTISYFDMAIRVGQAHGLPADWTEDSWEPIGGLEWMVNMRPEMRTHWERELPRQLVMVDRFNKKGVRLGTGTDIWQLPWAVHQELEELVRAGLTPLQAIHAGTGAAAEILGAEAELGTIAAGKRADLLILDEDPLQDIRNTRKIHAIIKDGALIDRTALRATAKQNWPARM